MLNLTSEDIAILAFIKNQGGSAKDDEIVKATGITNGVVAAILRYLRVKDVLHHHFVFGWVLTNYGAEQLEENVEMERGT